MTRLSIAMTADTDRALTTHLIRDDGQEDLCLATYRVSTGQRRTSYLLTSAVLPQPGERSVHRNVSFTGDYVMRASTLARQTGQGVAIVHSHPHGSRWQELSTYDFAAEQSYARLVDTLTGLPLVGMTLAGQDRAWSARSWTIDGDVQPADSVRIDGSVLRLSWNDELCPPPPVQRAQERTISAWGEATQADLARLRVLVVGVGSVGLDVAQRLAATGIERLGLLDFDTIEDENLDRLIGASAEDARAGRKKVDLAKDLCLRAATAAEPVVEAYDLSICTPDGHAVALDYDVIFSCVDRPWPRAVLNGLAYADLIPVIDGGIAIDVFADGTGMRGATWRNHVLRPGRPCLVCNGQLDPALIVPDRQGLLDDPRYIAGASHTAVPGRQNVATLCASVSAGQLAQFLSLVVAPGGLGEPGPLQYQLAAHRLHRIEATSRANCPYETAVAAGDTRPTLTDRSPGQLGR